MNMTNDYVSNNKDEHVFTGDYQLLIEELPMRVGIHNRNHTERVLILSSLLAEEYKLTSKERKTLYSAVVYHDVGRKDDTVDPDHGWGGYIEYIKRFGSNDIVEFLIVFHCKPDVAARKFLGMKQLGIDNDRVWLLYQILKDADALDRIRFNGLDTKYLRLEKSHELIEIATYMIEIDKQKKR